MADTPRIELLRRRVQQDPASIAFAQLAEEHRRIGELEEAVRVARAGLAQHPGYVSARVTLGRALLELGRLDEAAPVLEAAVNAAPDNLSAIRALAEIHQKRGEMPPEPELNLDLPPIADTDVVDVESFQRALASLDEIAFEPPKEPSLLNPALDALESWYAAILRDRRSRTSSH